MTDRDALVLTLIRGLEGATMALDVVDDATRQHIGGLLSPKARRLLAALTAPAPPPPTEAPEPVVEEPPEKKKARCLRRPRGSLRRHELRRPPGGRARRHRVLL